MAHKNPHLDRTGSKQNLATRIASRLNWERRMALGFTSMAHIHLNMLAFRQDDAFFTELTGERREQLDNIHDATISAKAAAKRVCDEIDKYFDLPIIPKQRKSRATKKEE